MNEPELIQNGVTTMKRFSGAILLFIALAVGSALIVHALECPSEPSWTPPKVKAFVTSPGIHQKIGQSPEETIFLPPLDSAKTAEAGVKSRQTGSPLQIGVHRPISEDSKLKWRVISEDSNRVAVRLAIHSPEAVMIRPHFTSFPPPGDATVYVYGDDPETAEGPVVKPEFIDTGDFWGPPIRTENYFIEVVLPAGEYEPHLPVIDKVSHVYLDAFSQIGNTVFPEGCMIDLSCRPEYAEYGAGVAALAHESNNTTGFCTGALLNDLDGTTQIPWFLTAHHCEITGITAPSTYFYFHFQTAVCNGEPPALPETAPRVDGAFHVLDYVPSDVTLLRLRGATPPGATLLGWKTDPVEVGVDTFCIHHPEAEFKRISFGRTSTEHPTPFNSFETHIENDWTEGIVADGSSGSPLFNSDGLVIGQLTGGYSHCDALLYDYYGRFSVSWANGLSRYLNGPVRPPVITAFSLGNGSGYLAKRTVALTLKGTGNPTHYMVSEAEDFAGAKWKIYRPWATLKFTLNDGIGARMVYAKLRNGAGESASETTSIRILEKPQVSIFTINNGSRTTTSHTVTLDNVAGGNPDFYMASQHRDFRGASWQEYSAAPSFTLSAGKGIKRVFFKVKNLAAESAPKSDSIWVSVP